MILKMSYSENLHYCMIAYYVVDAIFILLDDECHH
jgi:hypothetical protein